ncbi:hypothetical protein [Sinorhizobium fredii]|uniref:hypothetical protein n=1 Tax=Rhizobium fredii TaxID=380 RepID=UPI003518445F
MLRRNKGDYQPRATNLTTFDYLSKTVRVIKIDEQPWFVTAEPAMLLYGRTTGLSDVYARLQADEKKVVPRADVNGLPLFAGTPAPRLLLISESGL